MAARSPRQAQRDQPRAGAPRERISDEEYRATGRMPFLRPQHVTEGESFKLTGFNTERDDQIIVEVENAARENFNLGIRKGSPDHRIMFHALGRNPGDWIGTITVTVAPSRRGGDGFVNVKSASPDEPPF